MLRKIKTPVPGPNSRKLIAELAEYESPAITARQLSRAKAGGIDCPIVWRRTSDVFVEDVDGNCFIDFTGGFGVANVGHAHPVLVEAAQQQMAEMPHAMGDAFPAHNKIALVKRLAQITPGHLKRTLLANSGSEAVEVALKTAMIKTGKPGVIAFENAYHGLGYGALAVTSYRERFREPFLSQLNPHIYRLPFPSSNVDELAQALEKTIREAESPIGALIIEPILGRGGILEASAACLQKIREITTDHHIMMIVDEVCTGFGRTGSWFAIEQASVVPDLLCMGKGMNGGFPISAVIGTDEAMEGWGDAKGEAIHTSTFLGNPVGCAMALICIDLLEKDLLASVNDTGHYFKNQLLALKENFPIISDVRGRGLMLGLEFQHDNKNYTLGVSKMLLQKGFIVLPCGLEGNVLSFTPPLTIQKGHIDALINELTSLILNNHV